jgi:hypothetical protein
LVIESIQSDCGALRCSPMPVAGCVVQQKSSVAVYRYDSGVGALPTKRW